MFLNLRARHMFLNRSLHKYIVDKPVTITFKHPRLILVLIISAVILLISLGLASVYHYNNYSGYYDPIFNNITIYGKDYDLGTLESIGNHESAHKFWFKDMTKEQRIRYGQIFKDANEFVSDYAKTNVAEDFADTVAYNTLCDLDLTSMPADRREFFKTISIGGITEIIGRPN